MNSQGTFVQTAHSAVTRKKATVTVTARRLSHDPWVAFSMEGDFPDGGGKQDKEKLKFDRCAGPFELSFHLKDKTEGLDLAFMDTFEQAMWIAAGSECPCGKGDGNGAISCSTPVKLLKLVVENANAVEETLTFALRFNGLPAAGGVPPYCYDPQIINGGGTNLE